MNNLKLDENCALSFYGKFLIFGCCEYKYLEVCPGNYFENQVAINVLSQLI